MSKNEQDAVKMVEQLRKLPEEVQERVQYIIQGAALVAGNRTVSAAAGSGRGERAEVG